MSSFALHKKTSTPSRAQVIESLAGNLCRCTGYRSIIDAAMACSDKADEDSFAHLYQQTVVQLTEFSLLPQATLSNVDNHYFAPKNIYALADKLLATPSAVLVAGGTDLALSVTQNLATIKHLVYTGDVVELNNIEETADEVIIGSAVPYSKFTPLLAAQYHELGEMIERIGSLQVRNNVAPL